MKNRLGSVIKIWSNLLRDSAERPTAPHSGNFQTEKQGRISGRITGLTSNFLYFFKLTLYIHLGSFMQIVAILKKFIRPDIRPDIRIVTKIYRDLLCYSDMNSWKFHAVSYYHFWVIVWTNIRKKIRITGRISGRMIKSNSNFCQYFKTSLSICPENFMQIGWILRKFIPNRISGRISGRITGSASNFHQYFKTTINTYLRCFIKIRWILRKFIRPDIRPDIRIVTKINRGLFWHRNMNFWKSHVVSYYQFWVIVWTNIHTKISNPDIRPDIRADDWIEFKLSPVI